MLCGDKILKNLKEKITVVTYGITDSTNVRARKFVAENPCGRALFAADGQTDGKGRRGRSFFSPPETGIYMTYAYRAAPPGSDTVCITAAASVAVARALGCGAKIKWVNDLYLHGKKICGILTERVTFPHGTYILIGVGVNLTTESFPESISKTAGSVNSALDREEAIAGICNGISLLADDIASYDWLSFYRENMLGAGERAEYTENGKRHSAEIIGIDSLGGLIVSEDGKRKILRSGEISLNL